MTIEDREKLAKAMGWQYKERDDDGRPMWVELSGMHHVEPPNPCTNPADFRELVEWTRKQEWFWQMVLLRNGTLLLATVSPSRCIETCGSFSEAFPKAVLDAISKEEPATDKVQKE